MLNGIEIKRIRGIQAGKLDNLSPLTILVGPNGSGKSSVLDALLIGSSSAMGDAVGRAVKRRVFSNHSAKDFFSSGHISATIHAWGNEYERKVDLSWQQQPDSTVFNKLEYERRYKPYSQITCVSEDTSDRQTTYVGFANDNAYDVYYEGRIQAINTRLIETTQNIHLGHLYSELVKQGKRRLMKQKFSHLIPDLDDIELLTDENDRPSLHIVKTIGEKEVMVPLALAGDGLVGFARLAFSLLVKDEDIMLIEEPEVHQHPACIHRSADVILEAVRDGKQVILTTHSMELIEALLSNNSAQPDQTALYKLVLKDGQLLTSRLSGDEILSERGSIEEDLR